MANQHPTTEREKEALAWATNAFRLKSAELEKGYLDNVREAVVKDVIEYHDYLSARGKGLFTSAPKVDETGWLIRNVSAELLKRNGQLPAELVDFAASSLREDQQSSRRPGPKKHDLITRDLVIGIVVYCIVKKWGFKRTRKRFSKTKAACAVSIAQAALWDGAHLQLSEDDIVKASNKFERFILVAIKGGLERPDAFEYMQEKTMRLHNTEAFRSLNDIGFKADEAFARINDVMKKPEYEEFRQLVRGGVPLSASELFRRKN